ALSACSVASEDHPGGSQQKGPQQAKTEAASAVIDIAKYETCIRDIAAMQDETIDDGWFFGEEPRLFKSFYRKTSPERKAEFAVAYHDFIEKSGEDLVRDFKSYVPYSKRADFAFDWWSKRV